MPAIEPAAPGDERVLVTVYEIGGKLTDVLSASVGKKLPLIPHVGVRLYGKEYFYSNCIEVRESHVMDAMLSDFPQVSLHSAAARLLLMKMMCVSQLLVSLHGNVPMTVMCLLALIRDRPPTQ